MKIPNLHCSREMADYLKRTCPCLHRKYKPTVWAFEGHLRTIARQMLQFRPAVALRRQDRLFSQSLAMLRVGDLGHVALALVCGCLPVFPCFFLSSPFCLLFFWPSVSTRQCLSSASVCFSVVCVCLSVWLLSVCSSALLSASLSNVSHCCL